MGNIAGGFILPGLSLHGGGARPGCTWNPQSTSSGNCNWNSADLPQPASTTVLHLALAGLLDSCFGKIRAEHDVELLPVITGGGAEQVLPLLPGHHIHEPHLVLQGLNIWGQSKNP